MRKYLIILFLGILISVSFNIYALRSPSPQRFTDFTDKSQINQLNDFLETIWNITNGRYNINIVTTNPDGNTKGDVGDILLFNDSGTYYLCINVTGSTIWRSVALTDTP